MATEFVEGEPLDQLVERNRARWVRRSGSRWRPGLRSRLVAIHAEDVVTVTEAGQRECAPTPAQGDRLRIATAAGRPPDDAGPGWSSLAGVDHPGQLLTGEASPASDVFAWAASSRTRRAGCSYGSGQIQTVFWRVLNQPPRRPRTRLPVLCDLRRRGVAYEPAASPSLPNSWSACCRGSSGRKRPPPRRLARAGAVAAP